MRLRTLLLLPLLVMACPHRATASLDFTLGGTSSFTYSFAPGSSFTETASFHNTSGDTIYLNGSNAVVDSPASLTDHFLSWPLSVNANDSTSYLDLFSIDVPLSATPGTDLFGTYEFLGGTTDTEAGSLSTLNFTIHILGGSGSGGGAESPEPSTLVLVGAGVVLFALYRRLRPAGRAGAGAVS